MTIKVRISGDAVKGFWDRAAEGVQSHLGQTLLQAAEYLAGEIRSVVMATFSGRTGGLARSWRSRFLGVNGRIAGAEAYSDLIYAGIQDTGGTIHPRTVSKLAIPLKDLPVGKWPRHFGKELTLIKSKKGNAILAKVKKNGQIEPYFVLKDSATIKGRQYVDKAIDQAMPEIESIMLEGINKDIDKAGKN